MADVHDKATRSYNMSQIKGKNTKPEMLVRRFLHAHGFRYRLHVKDLPGKPDIVLPKYKTVIFVHGCFWHGHKHCNKAKLPNTRKEWWEQKITNNIKNGENSIDMLQKGGWSVVVIWECNLKAISRVATLERLVKLLQ
jgi:DNA mismatch endonuclease (patch repair protein)